MKLPLGMLTILMLSGVVFVAAQGTSSCQAHFNEYNCPKLIDDYEDMDKLCCSNSNNHLKLHCISTQTGSKVIHACLEPQDIPAGYAISLEPPDSPQNISLILCTGKFYEPHSRSSTDVRHDYCTVRKTNCSHTEGATLVCIGGPTQDDLCGCAPEFEPNEPSCLKAFDEHDNCICVKQQCPPGRARNTSGMLHSNCPENRTVPLDYTCYPTLSPTPSPTPTHPPTRGSSSLEPPPHPTTPTTDDGNKLPWLGLLIIPFIFIVLVVLYCCNKGFRDWVTNCWPFTHCIRPFRYRSRSYDVNN